MPPAEFGFNPTRPVGRVQHRRDGTRNIFLTCEPLAGWRHVAITERRTMQDFAHQMRWLVDVAYPNTPVVRVVLDNLNTHRMASLYETFPAAEARRIAKRLEFHHTPKHASWLNMAEIEFQRVEPRLSQRQKPRRRRTATPNHGLRDRAQRSGRHYQLAIQYPRRQSKTPPPLPMPFQRLLSTSFISKGRRKANSSGLKFRGTATIEISARVQQCDVPGKLGRGLREGPVPKLKPATGAKEDWEMPKGLGKHTPTFKAKMALEAVKG